MKKLFKKFKRILSLSSRKKTFYNNSTFTKLDNNEVKDSNKKLITKGRRKDVEDSEDMLNMLNMIKYHNVSYNLLFSRRILKNR